MTKKERDKLNKLIDKGYLLSKQIDRKEAMFKDIKSEIKALTSGSNRKRYTSTKGRECLVFDRSYGYVDKPLKVWNACKGDRNLFFDLIKVSVTSLEDTFSEKVLKRLVRYRKIKCVSFR